MTEEQGTAATTEIMANDDGPSHVAVIFYFDGPFLFSRRIGLACLLSSCTMN